MKRIRLSIYQLWNASFIRFLLVGVMNTVVGLGTILLLFNWFGVGYWLSTFIGNTIGGMVSYFLNRTFTFRSSISMKQSWWKFILVVFICYVFSYQIGLAVFSSLNTYVPNISEQFWNNAAIVLGSGLYTVTNYIGHRYFTFKV